MSVVELRQYTMVPGRRDDFVEIFDREFVETQEALGIEVLGQFRDLDRPDRYVWLRRFADMESRRTALERFYGGPVWATHKDAANAMMMEWHDVLLLKPAWSGSGLVVDRADRAPVGAEAQRGAAVGGGGEMTVMVWPVSAERMDTFAAVFRRTFAGARGAYVTAAVLNSYPALPVREGESVFVGVMDGRVEAGDESLAGLANGTAAVLPLAPTGRSALRGG